jgi:chromate reductase
MKILVLSGSTRRDSFNTRLAKLVEAARPEDTVSIRADLATLPFFNADVEAEGIPAPVQALRSQIEAADLLIIVTPEYNGTVPGVLGNAVEWSSRPPGECVLSGKDVLVVSASPSPGGGRRAASHLRQVLTNAGAVPRPDGLFVPRAYEQLAGPAPDSLVAQLRLEIAAAATPASAHA